MKSSIKKMKIKLDRHPGVYAVIEAVQCYWDNAPCGYRGYVRFYEGKNLRSICSHIVPIDRLSKVDALDDIKLWLEDYEENNPDPKDDYEYIEKEDGSYFITIERK